MTLHEAIQKVLKQQNRPLSAIEIADLINALQLYKRGDGNPIPSYQILTRVKDYPSLFFKYKDKISLVEYNSIGIFSDEKITITNFLKRVDELLAIESGISDIERLLLVVECTIVLYEISNNKKLNLLGESSYEKFIKSAEYIEKRLKIRGIFNTIFKFKSFLRNSVLIYDSLVYSRIEKLNRFDFFKALSNYLQNSPILEKHDVGQFLTPEFLNKLMVKIVKPKNGDLIYDPAAGIGNSLLNVSKYDKEVKIIGQEINDNISNLCRLLLYLNNCENFDIINSNSLIKPAIDKGEANIIISNPPFSTKNYVGNFDFERFGTDNSLQTIFLEMMLSRLHPLNGKMAIILPDSFLWKSINSKIRKVLIDNDKLEAIISFPSETFRPYASINVKLLIINNAKRENQKGNILFLETDAYIQTRKLKNKEELNEKILKIYNEWVVAGKDIKPHVSQDGFVHNVVSNQNIIEQNFDLTFQKYLYNIDDFREQGWNQEEVVALRAILTTIKTKKNIEINKNLRLVQIKDLNDKKTEFYLNQNKLQIVDNIKPNYKILNKSALLVARIGENLKPTYFKYHGESIAVINNIFTFEVNTDVVNIEYLISQINSAAFSFQLQVSRPWTGVIPNTNQKTFLGLKISVPPHIEQIKKLAIYKKEYGNESELIQFINEIKLVTTPGEIKVEVEKFAKKIFPRSEHINFKTEFDFDDEKFPFSNKDIEETRFIKRPQNYQNNWFSYLLLIGDNNLINGVLTVESLDDITLNQYYEINAFANFIIQSSSKYIQQNTNKLLNDFNHTTKNILKDIDKILNDFLETKNEELIKSLKNNYLKDEKLINHLIKNSNRKKEDFIAFNRLEDAHNIVNKHFEFFKRRHQYYTNSVNAEFEIITLHDFIRKNLENRNNVIIDPYHLSNESIYIKCAPIELAFNDLIENALSYSPDGKLRIGINPKDHFIEFILTNNVENIISSANYNNLGTEDIKKSDGTYSTGLSNAFRAIKEDNDISLAPYEFYEKNKIFKISIKLKKS